MPPFESINAVFSFSFVMTATIKSNHSVSIAFLLQLAWRSSCSNLFTASYTFLVTCSASIIYHGYHLYCHHHRLIAMLYHLQHQNHCYLQWYTATTKVIVSKIVSQNNVIEFLSIWIKPVFNSPRYNEENRRIKFKLCLEQFPFMSH